MWVYNTILIIILFPKYQDAWEELYDFEKYRISRKEAVFTIIDPLQVILSSLRSPENKKNQSNSLLNNTWAAQRYIRYST